MTAVGHHRFNANKGEERALRTLDGVTFAAVMQAGTLAVLREQDNLDLINVFPVPDADTGANLAATLSAASARLGDKAPQDLDKALRIAAEGALDGARGNSGAILAQFFHGFAEGAGNRIQVGTREFAAAAVSGMEAAYRALQDPREGTILSVLRAWAQEMTTRAGKVDDFRDLMRGALGSARVALADTPKQLEVLAKNHVVDAGGQGFVYFLEGVGDFLEGALPQNWRQLAAQLTEARSHRRGVTSVSRTDVDTTYRYCVEGLVAGRRLDIDTLKAAVIPLGGSLVIAGGATRMRVHLHTNEPERFLAVLEGCGTVESHKVDDMIEQQLAGRQAVIAVVTDSTCDLPEGAVRSLALSSVPLTVSFGDEVYLDRVELDSRRFFDKLAESSHFPKSSQPSARDFEGLYRSLLDRYEGVVSVHIAAGMSGTVGSATTAASAVDPERIRVVDSRHLSVALGLIVEAAGEAAVDGAGLDEVGAATQEAIANTRAFGSVPSLDHAVRGGRMNARAARAAALLDLKPIVVFSGSGKVEIGGAQLGFKRAMRNLAKRAASFANGAPVRVRVVHADAPASAEYLVERLMERFPDIDISVVECGAVLGTHVGPGTVTVAVRRLPQEQGQEA